MSTSGPPASDPAATPRLVAASLKRKEDRRFLAGWGRYVDGLRVPGLAHLALVRSPHAHARVVRIDARRALRLPGVLAVLPVANAPGLAGSTPPRPPRGAGPAPSPAASPRPTWPSPRA